VLLGCYAANSGNSLPSFRDKLPVPSSRVKTAERNGLILVRCLYREEWAVKNSSVVPANRVDVGGRSGGEMWSISATLKLDVPGGGISNRCNSAVLERMRRLVVMRHEILSICVHLHS
jgi:hypothetical protein